MGLFSFLTSSSQSSSETAQTEQNLNADNGAMSMNLSGANPILNFNAPQELWPLLEAVVSGTYKTAGEIVGAVSKQAAAANELVDQQYNSLGSLQQFVKNLGPLAIIGGAVWLYFRKDKK